MPTTVADSRIQVVLDRTERDTFRAYAKAAGVSLSAWLRDAGQAKIAVQQRQRKLQTAAQLNDFFNECNASEQGIEPDWAAHKAVIAQSRASGIAPN